VVPTTTAYTGETGKIYRVSWGYSQSVVYLTIPILSVLAIAPLITILNDLRRRGSVSIVSLVVSLVAFGVGYLVWRNAKSQAETIFLVLSSAGIAYYGAGIDIKTTWANTKEITANSAMPCLMLYQPAATYTGLSVARDPLIDRRIPLYPFAYSKHSELARDLRRYAPHLF
jgi:hypothetical protein